MKTKQTTTIEIVGKIGAKLIVALGLLVTVCTVAYCDVNVATDKKAKSCSEGVYKGPYGGDIRIDPAPRWNRSNDAILVPGIAENRTRQMFMIRVVTNRD